MICISVCFKFLPSSFFQLLFPVKDGEPTTLTRERYLRLREAGFLFWSKGIKSTHYSNSPANISTFNPKDAAEVKELKVLIEQQSDVIKEQKTLMSRYSKQIEDFLVWKDEYDLNTSSLNDAVGRLQVVVELQQKKIAQLEENGPNSFQDLLKRVTMLEGRHLSHTTKHSSKAEEALKSSEEAERTSKKESEPLKKKEANDRDSLKQGKVSTKSISSSLSSKVVISLTKSTNIELLKKKSPSKSINASKKNVVKKKRSRDSTVTNEKKSFVEESVHKKVFTNKAITQESAVSNKVQGFDQESERNAGFSTIDTHQGSKEMKKDLPDSELIVRVPLSKPKPSIHESQKPGTSNLKEIVPDQSTVVNQMDKATADDNNKDISKEEAAIKEKDQVKASGASKESLGDQPCSMHMSEDSEAVNPGELVNGETMITEKFQKQSDHGEQG